MLTIREVLEKARGYLADNNIPVERLEAELLLAHALNCRRVDLFIRYDQPLMEQEVEAYRGLLRKRAARMPTAYLIGKKEFFGWEFVVGPGVLIPRPETELLVEAVADLLKPYKDEKVKVLDLGTGSGIIAVCLARMFPNLMIYAVDISEDALKIARENIDRHKVNEQVILLQGDLFAPLLNLTERELFIIVTNPPYIPTGEISKLAPEIAYEPILALDGGSDGLYFYRRILQKGKDFLSGNGYLLTEIGFHQADDVKKIALDNGWFFKACYHDLAGIQRVMVFSVKERG